MSGELLAVAFGCGLLALTFAASGEGAESQRELATPEEVELTTVQLWGGPAPGARRDTDEDRPRLDVLQADPESACGTAVIVCPGGGYNVRAMDYEGLQVARWLNGLGVHAFVLSYRVRRFGYDRDDAFADGRRAVRWVRHNAETYGVDPRRIGMIGFSAGGNLISRVALGNDPGDPDAADPVERQSCRPDFVMLIYTPMRRPGGDEEAPPAGADPGPPAFICHTAGDHVVSPGGVLEYLGALREAGVEVEIHVFGGYGPHGVGLASGLPGARAWPDLAASWMRNSGFMTAKERVSVEGEVVVDGASSGLARVTFIPVESDHDPIAGVLADLKTGAFKLDAKYGPVPGLHRVEVRQVCKQFLTVPTMNGEILHTRAAPGDKEPLTVNLTPGHNVVSIAISTK